LQTILQTFRSISSSIIAEQLRKIAAAVAVFATYLQAIVLSMPVMKN
jgi:hypothetical protein